MLVSQNKKNRPGVAPGPQLREESLGWRGRRRRRHINRPDTRIGDNDIGRRCHRLHRPAAAARGRRHHGWRLAGRRRIGRRRCSWRRDDDWMCRDARPDAGRPATASWRSRVWPYRRWPNAWWLSWSRRHRSAADPEPSQRTLADEHDLLLRAVELIVQNATDGDFDCCHKDAPFAHTAPCADDCSQPYLQRGLRRHPDPLQHARARRIPNGVGKVYRFLVTIAWRKRRINGLAWIRVSDFLTLSFPTPQKP